MSTAGFKSEINLLAGATDCIEWLGLNTLSSGDKNCIQKLSLSKCLLTHLTLRTIQSCKIK